MINVMLKKYTLKGYIVTLRLHVYSYGTNTIEVQLVSPSVYSDYGVYRCYRQELNGEIQFEFNNMPEYIKAFALKKCDYWNKKLHYYDPNTVKSSVKFICKLLSRGKYETYYRSEPEMNEPDYYYSSAGINTKLDIAYLPIYLACGDILLIFSKCNIFWKVNLKVTPQILKKLGLPLDETDPDTIGKAFMKYKENLYDNN